MDRLVDTFFGVDTELLHQADQVLAGHGISLAQAVTALLEQIVRDQSPPPQLLGAAEEAAGSALPADIDAEELEAAVNDVAKGSVFTSAEIKAYLSHMDEM